MIELNNMELLEIRGSGLKIGLVFAIGAGVAFVFGIIDGYIRPLKCN